MSRRAHIRKRLRQKKRFAMIQLAKPEQEKPAPESTRGLINKVLEPRISTPVGLIRAMARVMKKK
jgi:hypothetical protein